MDENKDAPVYEDISSVPYPSGPHAAAGFQAPPAPSPQPVAYPQQPQAMPLRQGSQITNVNTVQVVAIATLGDCPATVTCPTGGHQVTTQIHYQAGLLTWIVAGVIFITGVFFILGLCFFWIPFVIDPLKDVVHTCPIDGTVIGVYRRIRRPRVDI